MTRLEVREDLCDLVRDLERLTEQDLEELRVLVSIKTNARRIEMQKHLKIVRT